MVILKEEGAIAQKTGREQVAKLIGWEYLKKCDYSHQRPRPQHRKRDKMEQEKIKKTRLLAPEILLVYKSLLKSFSPDKL
ncbi:winged helix-turn-helix domain-containing protein [Microcoleus sp. BROC3]|uniref:winged helix-turn-helix domain-containing protein n=1 Tax=Microcoleus sp. BROC3 TaxID=3055323 RepID=UPI002FD56A84